MSTKVQAAIAKREAAKVKTAKPKPAAKPKPEAEADGPPGQ